MAKLLEIAASVIKNWPAHVERMVQGATGDIYPAEGRVRGRIFWRSVQLADDWAFAEITRTQWEAERARITTNQQAIAEGREIARAGSMTNEEQELAAIACGKRSAEDQALWDKVASESMSLFAATVQITKADVTYSFVAETACNAADAFMAERAKRLKGGV